VELLRLGGSSIVPGGNIAYSKELTKLHDCGYVYHAWWSVGMLLLSEVQGIRADW
jgi:hypothetical protein